MEQKDKRKIRGIIAIAIAIVLLWSCAIVGGYVYNSSIHAVNQDGRSLTQKRENLKRAGFDVNQLERKYQVTSVQIQSTFGDYKIPANYLTNGKENRDTVVMAHGLNGSRYTGYPVAKIFLDHGYNVLTYDQRDSGRSQVQCMTCGYWESRDFQDCVAYISSKVKPDKKIGAWGSSIGGATVGIYLGTEDADEKLDFAILDCPVNSMRDIIGVIVKDKATFLPQELKLSMGDMATRINLGFSYEDGNVCNYVRDTEVPVLIFNSKADKVTPYYMGEELYDAMGTNKKDMVTVKDSSHTDIYWDYPREYEEAMIEFINENVI